MSFEDEKRKSQADRLLDLAHAEDIRLFMDQRNDAYLRFPTSEYYNIRKSIDRSILRVFWEVLWELEGGYDKCPICYELGEKERPLTETCKHVHCPDFFSCWACTSINLPVLDFSDFITLVLEEKRNKLLSVFRQVLPSDVDRLIASWFLDSNRGG